MKTKTYHVSNLGSARNHLRGLEDSQGYVTIHDDPRYASLSREQVDAELLALGETDADGDLIVDEREASLITAALMTQLAELDIAAWQRRRS